MNDPRLQQITNTLTNRAEQLETLKSRKKELVSTNMRALRALIDTAENELLRTIDSAENIYSTALFEIGSGSGSPADYSRYEQIMQEPFPSFSELTENNFIEAKKVIFSLAAIRKREHALCPEQVVGDTVSNDAIELSWMRVAGAAGYQVEMRRSTEGTFRKVYEGDDLKHTVTGLRPSTKYLLRVRTICGNDETSKWSEVVEIKTPKIFIPAPENITAEALPWNVIKMSWDSVQSGLLYRVKVVEASENVSTSHIEECGRDTKHTIKGLQPDTKYNFSVQAGNGNEWSEWSDAVKGRTQKGPEKLPGNSMWKKCPDNVDVKRKYSVNEKNPRTATKINGDGLCTIIGNTPLPHNKVTSWSIKILKSRDNDGHCIWIGVAPFDIDQNDDCNCIKCGWYFHCGDSTLWPGPPHSYRVKDYGPRKGRGQYIHTGDSVGVVMDTVKGELSFAVNGVNLGIAFDGIPLDKPLVPCVLLYCQGDSVELII